MIDSELLAILCCPETKQSLRVATAEELAGLQARVQAGNLRNRAGQEVREPFEGLLVREDGCFGYVVRQEIPVMLVDEALPLAS